MAETEPSPATKRPGRNDPCHCGSGKKYKHCCLAKDEERERDARATAAEQAAAEQAAAEQTAKDEHPEHEAHKTPPRRPFDQPWRGARKGQPGFHKVRGPRKIGSS